MRTTLLKIVLALFIVFFSYEQQFASIHHSFVTSLGFPKSLSPTRTKEKVVEEKFGFQFIKNRKITKIPFELQANLIIIPLKINNSDTLHFILDTGVSTILITDPLCLQKQQLKPIRQVKIAGAGAGEKLEASIVLNNTIQLGEVTGYHQNLVILQEDILKLSEFVGRPIHGIIGYELFDRFAVTIDFNLREITLQNPESYKYKPSKGEKIAISIEDKKPYLNTLELIDSTTSVPIKVVLDTGAGHALSLDATANSKIKLPHKLISAQLGRGLSGIINGKLGRIQKLKIGKYTLQNLVASFPDSNSYKVIPNVMVNPRQGNIGCEFLRRFKVTFNYRDQYIVLKASNKFLKEPFEHNMTGMELAAKGQNYNEYLIERIEANSPAESAGLQEGDKLLFVNDKSSRDISISELYKLFQKGEGKPLNFVVKRGNGLFVTTLTLKRAI
ncbi:aspartyl protease family protein [Flectobacillus roseus]|uniref:aspartyl protease family protein n=1 Tax=Flectobacillus roseus TaxID=502259 RepID=UPI0024B6B965|nr:aspartyl protease family protein [Flectobacillus roseus]MDI9870944.1 aspartyl protease family protein [Flectobacillus roseus]